MHLAAENTLLIAVFRAAKCYILALLSIISKYFSFYQTELYHLGFYTTIEAT